MYLEYAVEPKAIGESWENFRYLIEKFGFDRGRLISRYPKKWFRLVFDEAANLKPIEKKRIEEALTRAKQNKIIRTGRSYNGQEEWLQNALSCQGADPFHAIISAEENTNESVVCVEGLAEDHDLLKCPRTCKIPQTGGDIAKALAPLLLSATKAFFIDPYFNVSNTRNNETLKNCLEVFAANGSQGLRCEVHFRDMDKNVSTEVIEREAANWLVGVIPNGMSVVFYSWEQKHRGEQFHDRFLLTDRGGVQLGAGFMARGNGKTVNISLLDEEACEKERAIFARSSSVYNLTGPVIEIFSDCRVVHI